MVPPVVAKAIFRKKQIVWEKSHGVWKNKRHPFFFSAFHSMSFVNACLMVSHLDAGCILCLVLRDTPGLSIQTQQSFKWQELWGRNGCAVCHLYCKTIRSDRPMDFKPQESKIFVKIRMLSWELQAKMWRVCTEESSEASLLNGRSLDWTWHDQNPVPQASGFLLPREEFGLCNLQCSF